MLEAGEVVDAAGIVETGDEEVAFGCAAELFRELFHRAIFAADLAATVGDGLAASPLRQAGREYRREKDESGTWRRLFSDEPKEVSCWDGRFWGDGWLADALAGGTAKYE